MTRLHWDKNEPLSRLEEVVLLPEFKKCQIIVINGMSKLKKPVMENHIFTGEDFEPVLENGVETDKDRLYLYYDVEKSHVAGIKKMKAFIEKRHTHFRWCHGCMYMVNSVTTHNCDGPDERKILTDARQAYTERKKERVKCEKCGEFGGHICQYVNCKHCTTTFNKAGKHRCILWVEERKEEKNTWQTIRGVEDGKLKSLWAYDFESRIIKTRLDPARLNVESFNRDEDGYFFRGDDGFVEVWTHTVDEHKVNFVYCINVFTGEEKYFFPGDGDLDDISDPIQRFLSFACTFNQGNNTFAAHNAKGYDSRLLLHHVYKTQDRMSVNMIKNGSMLIQLKIGHRTSPNKTVFIDTMSHLPGSLKKLAKDMCGDLLTKGYFPHRFNTPENYDYVGPLPSKEMFDVYFGARSKKDVDEFEKWWDEENAKGVPWNFMEEMKYYNRNDVLVLADIMKKYNDIMVRSEATNLRFALANRRLPIQD